MMCFLACFHLHVNSKIEPITRLLIQIDLNCSIEGLRQRGVMLWATRVTLDKVYVWNLRGQLRRVLWYFEVRMLGLDTKPHLEIDHLAHNGALLMYSSWKFSITQSMLPFHWQGWPLEANQLKKKVARIFFVFKY